MDHVPTLQDTFESIDLAAIHGFVEQRRQEGLRLEFKTLGNHASFEREDRVNLAKAISGFSNSDGGIVVWGIQACRDEERVDAASELKPIKNLDRALSDILSYTSQATSPLASGVDSRAIAEGDGAGYLVTYVPVTDGPPHMAMLGEHRYYRRTGDSFRKMEHFEIADMFGKRLRPELSLFVQFVPFSMAGSYRPRAIVGIENSGRGMARSPALSLRVERPYKPYEYGLDGNGTTGLPSLPTRLARGRLSEFGAGAGQVVHAGAILEITQVYGELTDSIPPECRIGYTIRAEGIPPVEGTRVIPGDEIAAVATEPRPTSP